MLFILKTVSESSESNLQVLFNWTLCSPLSYDLAKSICLCLYYDLLSSHVAKLHTVKPPHIWNKRYEPQCQMCKFKELYCYLTVSQFLCTRQKKNQFLDQFCSWGKKINHGSSQWSHYPLDAGVLPSHPPFHVDISCIELHFYNVSV